MTIIQSSQPPINKLDFIWNGRLLLTFTPCTGRSGAISKMHLTVLSVFRFFLMKSNKFFLASFRLDIPKASISLVCACREFRTCSPKCLFYVSTTVQDVGKKLLVFGYTIPIHELHLYTQLNTEFVREMKVVFELTGRYPT